MGRPRSHDETTAEALLDAAEHLLATEGLEAVSVRAVADLAGTTTRAVYSLFGSKDGLVQGLCRRGFHLLITLIEEVDDTPDPIADLVELGVTGFRRFALTRPHLFRLSFERIVAAVALEPSVQRAAAASFETLLHHVRRATSAGLLADQAPQEVAYLFHALCQGLASTELQRVPPPAGPGWWDFVTSDPAGERLWRDALSALLQGMGPRSAPGR